MDANTTIVIALTTLVLAIFGASWLSQRQTEKLLEQLGKRFDAKFDAIATRIDNLEKRFDAKFEILTNRMENVEKRLDRVERQLESIFKPILPK